MTVTVNQRRLLAKGRVFDITQENITLPNGFCTDLDIIRHPGAAAIVPVTDFGEVLMLKQYRHAIGSYLWEIPAGTLNETEEPIACAQRELVEETGFKAAHWVFLADIVPVPGYSDERIHLYMAYGLTPSQQKLDPDEILEVHTLSAGLIKSMIAQGEIKDAKTITAILLSAARTDSPAAKALNTRWQ